MRNSLSQWWFGRAGMPGWRGVEAACADRGWIARRTREHDGFVVEPTGASEAHWRLEWGPARRHYLAPHEWRLRAPLACDPALHALIIPRPLQQRLERDLFQQFVEGVQTQLNDDTPEEVRWLAMLDQLSPGPCGALHPAFSVLGNAMGWMPDWVAGDWSRRLRTGWPEQAPTEPVDQTWVLRRAELVWRVALPDPPGAEVLLDGVDLFLAVWHSAAQHLRPDLHPDPL